MFKNRILLWALASIFLILTSCGAEIDLVQDDQPHLNSLTPSEEANGWRLLFDGHSLAGWEDPADKDPPGDSWVVQAGCIKAIDHPRIREDLFTVESFGDFEFAFEWRITTGGNSGVKYRIQDRVLLVEKQSDDSTQEFEARVDYELSNRTAKRSDITPGDINEEYVVAFEYQLIDDLRHPDAAKGPDRWAGALYSMAAPSERKAKPVGQWNQSRIVLCGNRSEHWLNGFKVVETDLASKPILAGLEKRWTKASPVYQLLKEQPRKETPIGLQNHNNETWFRNIKIRSL